MDLKKAFQWYQKSAESGHSEAQRNLANCYKNGEGTDIDLEKAFQWYQKSSETLNLKIPDGSYVLCNECASARKGFSACKICLIKHCEETFLSSGNQEIDAILRYSNSQISESRQILEFIPFTNFDIIEKIGEGGFGKVRKAQWINGGVIEAWDQENNSWRRRSPPPFIALKSCSSWQDFINEVG